MMDEVNTVGVGVGVGVTMTVVGYPAGVSGVMGEMGGGPGVINGIDIGVYCCGAGDGIGVAVAGGIDIIGVVAGATASGEGMAIAAGVADSD